MTAASADTSVVRCSVVSAFIHPFLIPSFQFSSPSFVFLPIVSCHMYNCVPMCLLRVLFTAGGGSTRCINGLASDVCACRGRVVSTLVAYRRLQLSQPATASSHCLLNVLEKLGVFDFFAVHWCCLVAVVDVSVSAESFLE